MYNMETKYSKCDSKKKLDSYIRRDIYISHFYTFMRIWPVIKSADIFLTVTDAECVYFAF